MTAARITVLSLNTAIDRTMQVRGLRLGQVHRAERGWIEAGGKGLNVARVVRQLGAPVRVIGFLGGTPRAFIERRCDELGIEQHWTATEGESRSCVILSDPETGEQTVANEPGPMIGSQEMGRLLHSVEELLEPGDVLAISGSLPQGLPPGFYASIITRARRAGARVLLDAGGETLRTALPARPWAVAPNLEECRGAVDAGTPLEAAHGLAAFSEVALLTLGSDGVILVGPDGAYRVHPPRITTVNAVGSGDAFVAGFVVGTARGDSTSEAVRLGTACGAANAARFEQGIDCLEDLATLLAQVRLEPLAGR